MFHLPLSTSGVLAEVIRRQPPSAGRTALAWQLVVGPALARATTVALDEAGVLTVAAADPRWTAEIERAREAVLARLQQLLGPQQVRRIKTRVRP